MRTVALAVVIVAVSSSLLVADDHSVIFDEDVDFSTFKTFSLRDGRMRSERSELNFPAVLTTLKETIRAALKAHGLTEASGSADLIVEHIVTGVDYRIGPFGRANVVRQGAPGRGRNPISVGQVDFTEAALVIDLKRADSGALVWRGVYNDSEKDAQKLADALPNDAATLLSHWPTRKK